jgi:hypothetical protein
VGAGASEMAQILLQKGGEADLAALDGDRVSLRSTVASAPGSPLAGTLTSGSTVRVKVHRCRREGDGFLIEGRLVDATRLFREELAALLPSASQRSKPERAD